MNKMQSNEKQMDEIKTKLRESLQIIKMYEWLLDSFVLVSSFMLLNNKKKVHYPLYVLNFFQISSGFLC